MPTKHGLREIVSLYFHHKFDRKWWFQALTGEFDSSQKLKNLDDFSRSGNIPSFICEKESEWPLYQLQLHVATPATGKSTNLANLKVNPKDIGLQKRTRNLPKCLPDTVALTTTNSKYGFIRMNFALEQYKQIYARQYHLEESIYNRRFCLCVCL